MNLLFLLFSIAAAWAEPPAMSLKQILPLALERSPYIKAQNLEVKAKENLISAASAWANPELTIETDKKEQPVDNRTSGMRYGFSQSISFPGRIGARKAIAQSNFAIEKINASSLELQTRIEVTNLFYEYAADIEKAKHAEERLKRFQSVSQYLRSRTFASPRKRTESSIVSSKILILQKELEKAKSEVDITWNKLNIYLDMPNKVMARVSWFKNPIKLSEQDILERALEGSPEVAIADQEAVRGKQEVRLAKREIWPEFRLLGSVSSLSGYDPEKVYTLGIAFPLPVFNMNIATSRAQTFRAEAGQIRQEAVRRNLKKLINSAYIRHLTNQKSLQLLQVSKVSEIEKDFEASSDGFRKGLVDLVTYIEADNQHSDAINAIYDTQVEYVESIGQLSFLSGDFLIPMEP